MSVLSVANLNSIMDSVLHGYVKLVGTSGSGYGMGSGSYGTYDKIDDAVTTLAGAGNLDASVDFGRGLLALRDAMIPATRFAEQARAFVSQLDRHFSRFGSSNFSNTETFLKYYNTGSGGTWTALQDRNWRTIYNAIRGGTTYPANYNLYFEVLQGTLDDAAHLYTNGLGKFVATGAGTGNFTKAVVEGSLIDGGSTTGSVDSTKYAGGVGSLKVSGLTGTGNVTVTGIGFDPATRAVTTSKTWITSVTANGDTAVVVGGGTAPANCLLVMVTNITIAAGISAGTIYVEGKRPTGRLLIS